jgi:NADH dehydrogenase FAD-containing subunit
MVIGMSLNGCSGYGASRREHDPDKRTVFPQHMISVAAGRTAHPLRPLEQFITQWPRVHVQMMANAIDGGETSTLSVIGGGAGGVEVALTVAWRARAAGAARTRRARDRR